MSDVVITPLKNGPYHVRGNVTIVTPKGKTITTEGKEIVLCRCGHSGSKPFCDGTHRRVGFQSDLDAAPVLADAGYEDVCAESDVPEGEIKGVKVGGAAVVLGRVEGTLYAVGGICTHADAPLEDGELDGTLLRCPLHDSGFDIRTGHAVRPPAVDSVPTYDVKVEGGRVLVSTKPR